MAQAVMNLRVDSDDKKKFDDFCNAVGMNISVAVNMFVKAVIREQRLPFEIKVEFFGKDVVAAVAEGRSIAADERVKGYDNMAELRRALEE